MKYKKYSYIIVLILMLTIEISPTYARRTPAVSSTSWEEKKCYYMSDDQNVKIRLKMRWKTEKSGSGNAPSLSDLSQVTIDKLGENNYLANKEGIINWWNSPNLWPRKKCIDGNSVCFDFKYEKRLDALYPVTSPSCPKYLVAENNGQIAVWATDSNTLATTAETESKKNGNVAYYAQETTQDKYYAEFEDSGLVEYDDGEFTCTDYNTLFGDKDNPESISYMIHSVLKYIRIIVPILIILLGTIDFAKAVIAGKEDNMRKAQIDFVKRIIMGVAVFFVPLLVDIIMQLADIVWAGEYIHCPL